jgi:hypothetical protein
LEFLQTCKGYTVNGKKVLEDCKKLAEYIAYPRSKYAGTYSKHVILPAPLDLHAYEEARISFQREMLWTLWNYPHEDEDVQRRIIAHGACQLLPSIMAFGVPQFKKLMGADINARDWMSSAEESFRRASLILNPTMEEFKTGPNYIDLDKLARIIHKRDKPESNSLEYFSLMNALIKYIQEPFKAKSPFPDQLYYEEEFDAYYQRLLKRENVYAAKCKDLKIPYSYIYTLNKVNLEKMYMMAGKAVSLAVKALGVSLQDESSPYKILPDNWPLDKKICNDIENHLRNEYTQLVSRPPKGSPEQLRWKETLDICEFLAGGRRLSIGNLGLKHLFIRLTTSGPNKEKHEKLNNLFKTYGSSQEIEAKILLARAASQFLASYFWIRHRDNFPNYNPITLEETIKNEAIVINPLMTKKIKPLLGFLYWIVGPETTGPNEDTDKDSSNDMAIMTRLIEYLCDPEIQILNARPQLVYFIN